MSKKIITPLLFFVLSLSTTHFLTACSPDETMQTNTQTPIIDLVIKNDLIAVEKRLKEGVNVNTSNAKKESLLLLATKANQLPMAQLLLAYHADVNQQDQQLDSPFLLAAASGHLDLVRLYLQHGARFDIYNRYNGTGLIPACERGHVEIVRLLTTTKGYPIDHVNRLGWTGLMEAVILGDGSAPYVEIVQLLVNAKASDIPDKNGLTALEHAKMLGYTAIVALLKNK